MLKFKVKVVLWTDAEPYLIVKYDTIGNSSSEVMGSVWKLFEDYTITSITVKPVREK